MKRKEVMNERYRVLLTELSADERERYNGSVELLLKGKLEGLTGALNVLSNSRPMHLKGGSWAKEVITAYRNLGKILTDSVGLPEKFNFLNKYEDVLSGNGEQTPYDRVLLTLKDLTEIDDSYHGLLKSYPGGDFVENLKGAVSNLEEILKVMRNKNIEDADSLEGELKEASENKEKVDYLKGELEKFENL